ncbi:hypothetical protein E3P94_00767 [Wallemia ichthyophaga]|nr:hypothetical protein E3P95_00505 [Wallemia ichthyophaga]TIB04235.1 hypothetical protein E3P94_00767 [Wallemia ichthyophaga]
MFNLDVYSYTRLITHSANLKEIYLNASTDQLMVLACVYNTIWTYSISEITSNVSQVDRVWTILPLLYTVIPAFDLAFKTYLEAPPSIPLTSILYSTVNQRALLLLTLQLIWSARLTFNTARRGLMAFASEDYRWPIVRGKLNWWQFKLLNLFFVAIAQNILHLITGIPALIIAKTPQYDVNRNDYLIFGLGVANITAEFIADNQQYAYQSWKRASSTKIASEKDLLTPKEKKLYADGFNSSGLFAISRHPNFAFEQLNWWIWSLLVVLGTKLDGVDLLSVFISPLSMSLLFEASTRLTESISLSKYPSYNEYRNHVAMFIPQFTLLKKIFNKLILILSLSTRTYFQPDEYFQSLEVAHWMRYGFGYLTWEWENRIRSVAYPAIYAVGYTLGDWANIPVQVTPKILNALFAAIQDIALIAFMRREYGNEKAMSYLTKSLVVISLAAAIRPTNVLIWIPLAADLLIRRTVNRLSALMLAIGVGLFALISVVSLDSMVYGSFTITPVRFIQSNIINSVSHFYGTSSALYYITQAWPILLNTSIVYTYKAVVDMRTPTEKALRNTLIFVTGVYTLIAHKEWRFIQPLLPIAMALTASRMNLSKKTVKWLAVGVIPALYLLTTHMRGQVEVSEWVGEVSGVRSVGFYMPCHSTPWQSHIHRPDLTLYAVQCEPGGYNEEDVFYASPVEFMRKRHLEDVVIVFEALLIDYSDLHAELLKQYEVTLSLFNTVLHEDSRRRAHRGVQAQRQANVRNISKSIAKSQGLTAHRTGRLAVAGATSMLLVLAYYSHNADTIRLDTPNTPTKPILAGVLQDLESHLSKDSDTGVKFPNEVASVHDSGALKLLGLGVRTVSFLSIRVYSLGIYAEESAHSALSAVENVKEKLTRTASQDSDMVGEKLMERLITSPYTFAVRIVPVRNTDFGHLRDGFVRAVQARMKTSQLGAEESQQVNESLQTFKSFFPPSKVPKGDELTLTKTRSGDLVLSYKGDTLGRLDSKSEGVKFISTQLLLAYFADKNPISPKAKASVINRL